MIKLALAAVTESNSVRYYVHVGQWCWRALQYVLADVDSTLMQNISGGKLPRRQSRNWTDVWTNSNISSRLVISAPWPSRRFIRSFVITRTLAQRIPPPRRVLSGSRVRMRSLDPDPDFGSVWLLKFNWTSLSNDTSTIKFSWKSDQFFRDISEIVEHAIATLKSPKKFMDPD